MNPFSAAMRPNPMQNMMRVMQQVQQIKQNPNQLGAFLKSRGVIDDAQAQEISKMGGNYAQIGQYLIGNGTMPQPSQDMVNQAQQAMQT